MNQTTPSVTSDVGAFRRHLRVLEREVMRQLEAETRCCEVTVSQCHVLLELALSDFSLNGLAGALDLDSSTLSRTVDALVRAGLVKRTEDPSDRRALRLSLTAAGQAKVGSINETCDRYYAHLLAGMGEQDKQGVLRAVELMAERMRALRGGSCCSRTDRADG
jgi:DNA-binding MarR family transcriptional regulator